jgi:hypothetical protein
MVEQKNHLNRLTRLGRIRMENGRDRMPWFPPVLPGRRRNVFPIEIPLRICCSAESRAGKCGEMP